MEENAPNQVIGTGSLEVEPKMQAVHEELSRIDRELESLKEKSASVFDGMEQGVKRVAEEVAKLVAKIAEVKIEVPPEPSPQAPAERNERVPRPDTPEADSRIDDAEDRQFKEEVLQKLDQIIALKEESLNRDPD